MDYEFCFANTECEVSYCYRSYQYKERLFLFVHITQSCLIRTTKTFCRSGKMSPHRQVTKQGYTTRGDTFFFFGSIPQQSSVAQELSWCQAPHPPLKCLLSNLPNTVLRGCPRSSHWVLHSQQWSLTCKGFSLRRGFDDQSCEGKFEKESVGGAWGVNHIEKENVILCADWKEKRKLTSEHTSS